MRGTHLPPMKETNDCRLERANQRVAFSKDREVNRLILKYLNSAQLNPIGVRRTPTIIIFKFYQVIPSISTLFLITIRFKIVCKGGTYLCI